MSHNPSYNTFIKLMQMERFLDQMFLNRIYQKQEEIRTYAVQAHQLVEQLESTTSSRYKRLK